MNILIMSWRDIENIKSGGAEIMTHEISKMLVKKGHSVTVFTSIHHGLKKNQIKDGVKIIREGHTDIRHLLNSVQFKAFIRYRKNFKKKFDLVIDQVHGVSFFTNFYVKEKKVILFCEVAGNLWDISVNSPFNYFGKFVEKLYPFLYREDTIFSISSSTKDDLVNLGFKKENLKILPMGSSSRILMREPKKEKTPTLVFLSRITKSKGIIDAIKTVELLSKSGLNIKLWVIGRGSKEFTKYVKETVKSLNLESKITFFDYVSEKKKEILLSKAHVLISPSAKEGWGLTIHEAASCYTPAIVYSVEGLRDVVKNGVNGLICKTNTPEDMASNIRKILKNKKLYKKLQYGAIQERKKYSWEKAADFILNEIKLTITCIL